MAAFKVPSRDDKKKRKGVFTRLVFTRRLVLSGLAAVMVTSAA
jgi:hypothetical protein